MKKWAIASIVNSKWIDGLLLAVDMRWSTVLLGLDSWWVSELKVYYQLDPMSIDHVDMVDSWWSNIPVAVDPVDEVVCL